MSPTDSDRVFPRATLTRRQDLAVEDHAARIPALDGGTDECVVTDGDRAVAGVLQRPAYELAE